MIIAAMLVSALLQEQVENPEYKGWASFKPGSSVTYKYSTQNGGQKVTLKSVGDSELVVESEITYEGKTGKPTERKIPAKVSKDALMQNPKEGEDTIDAAGKSLKCRTREGEMKVASGKTTLVKVWIHEDVPGSAVKVQYSSQAGVGFTMTASEWEKK